MMRYCHCLSCPIDWLGCWLCSCQIYLGHYSDIVHASLSIFYMWLICIWLSTPECVFAWFESLTFTYSTNIDLYNFVWDILEIVLLSIPHIPLNMLSFIYKILYKTEGISPEMAAFYSKKICKLYIFQNLMFQLITRPNYIYTGTESLTWKRFCCLQGPYSTSIPCSNSANIQKACLWGDDSWQLEDWCYHHYQGTRAYEERWRVIGL